MKLNKRVPTALIFGIVYIGLLYLNADFFSIMLSVFTALGVLEFYRLLQIKLSIPQRILGVIAALAVNQLLYAFKTNMLPPDQTSNILSFFLIGSFFFAGLFGRGVQRTKQAIAVMSGVFYVGFPFGMTHFLTHFPFGTDQNYTPQLLLGLISLIWANDICAYYVGSAWGRHKILPIVSPGKSWEGFAGGGVGSILAALFLSGIIGILSPTQWIISAGIATVFGTAGDFIESWMKRRAGVKDSGSLLPGHGGILDRFDAYLLAVPVMVFYLYTSA